jgi:hypothetical protein
MTAQVVKRTREGRDVNTSPSSAYNCYHCNIQYNSRRSFVQMGNQHPQQPLPVTPVNAPTSAAHERPAQHH